MKSLFALTALCGKIITDRPANGHERSQGSYTSNDRCLKSPYTPDFLRSPWFYRCNQFLRNFSTLARLYNVSHNSLTLLTGLDMREDKVMAAIWRRIAFFVKSFQKSHEPPVLYDYGRITYVSALFASIFFSYIPNVYFWKIDRPPFSDQVAECLLHAIF